MITNSSTMRPGYFFTLFIALFTFSCLGSPYAGAAVRTVTVGVYENAPKIFTSESGTPSGIFIDIIEHIAKSEGWELRYVSGTWAEGLDRLERGEIDLMPDVAYTAKREKIYSFHKVPVLSVWSQVYAPQGSGIQSILDLNGKRVAALEQTIQLETFKRLTNSFGLKITLIPVPDYKTEFEMIAKGKADAGVTNRFYGLMYARKSGLEDTPVMFDPAPFFFAAVKGDPKQLLNTIDSRLSELKKDSQSAYYASLKRWTSEEVRFKLPGWLKVLGLVVGVVLLMSVAGSFLLKRQVTVRTRELEQINKEMEQRIAERKKAEETLRYSEQKFMKAFHATPDAIVISRATDGLLLEVNEVFLRQAGYSRDEVLNRTTGNFDLWADSADRERYVAGVREQGKVRDMEAQFRTKTGVLLDGLVSGESIVLADDLCLLTIIRDITERKKIEQELEKHRLHLEEMVNERTNELKRSQDALRCSLGEMTEAKRDLEAANARLKELDRLKSLFIASMSHELRTPLNSIIGFTGILLQGLAGELNAEQRKQLGMVKSSSEHLLLLITDIIDLSKIEAGKIDLSMEPFELAGMVSEVLGSFQIMAERKALTLSSEIPSGLTLVSDKRRIRQVLVNLVGNAMKFTEQGGVSVRARLIADFGSQISDSKKEAEQSAFHNPHSAIEISVVDTGMGIKREDLDRLFKSFSQVTTAEAPKHEGAGLGLYLSRKLITLLGGEINVESEFGKGSVFTFVLPMKQ